MKIIYRMSYFKILCNAAPGAPRESKHVFWDYACVVIATSKTSGRIFLYDWKFILFNGRSLMEICGAKEFYLEG